LSSSVIERGGDDRAPEDDGASSYETGDEANHNVKTRSNRSRPSVVRKQKSTGFGASNVATPRQNAQERGGGKKKRQKEGGSP